MALRRSSRKRKQGAPEGETSGSPPQGPLPQPTSEPLCNDHRDSPEAQLAGLVGASRPLRAVEVRQECGIVGADSADTVQGCETPIDDEAYRRRHSQVKKRRKRNKQQAYEALQAAPYLCELHTHLMGMGNAEFWIDEIILNREILPPDGSETADGRLLLVWNKERSNNDEERSSFFGWRDTVKAFGRLRRECFNKKAKDRFEAEAHRAEEARSQFYATAPSQDQVRKRKERAARRYAALPFEEKCFCTLRKKFAALWRSLPEDQLKFVSFTFDVVFSLEKLAQGLGVTDTYRGKKKSDDTIQVEIEEILGLSCALGESSSGNASETQESPFKRYVVWNARKQEFRLVHGIQCSLLRRCLTQDDHDRIRKSARARVINAFSMRNADGSDPRAVDFQTIFRGTFTPEFYPRRFALKDCLYEQRLDVLCCLLKHVLNRYQTSCPPVSYVEFSVGVNDLSTPWVLYVLRVYENVRGLLGPPAVATSRPHLKDLGPFFERFPHISSWGNMVDYRFLAAFGRHDIKKRIWPAIGCDPVSLLNFHPAIAITKMMEEIDLSQRRNCSTNLFQKAEEKLEALKKGGKPGLDGRMIVGLDLVGDETGYPYCPFVTRKFIEFVKERRERMRAVSFGVRVHCAENIPVIRAELETYRAFAAHLYIVVIGLAHLVAELGPNAVRIGHGVGFHSLSDDSLCLNRKSNVLLRNTREVAHRDVWPYVTFELNPTSNYFLLSPLITGANSYESLRSLVEASTQGKIGKLVISTDDDGILDIARCKRGCLHHHSLAAEFCNAIHDGILTSRASVTDRISQSFEARFGTQQRKTDPPRRSEPLDAMDAARRLVFDDCEADSEEYRISKRIADMINDLIEGRDPSDVDPSLVTACHAIFETLINPGHPYVRMTPMLLESRGEHVVFHFVSSLESVFPISDFTNLVDTWLNSRSPRVVIVAFVSCQVKKENLEALKNHYQRVRASEIVSGGIHIYITTSRNGFESARLTPQYDRRAKFQIVVSPGSTNHTSLVLTQSEPVPSRFCAICPHGPAASLALDYLCSWITARTRVSLPEPEPPGCEEFLVPYEPLRFQWVGGFNKLVNDWRLKPRHPARRYLEERKSSVKDGYSYRFGSNLRSFLRDHVESRRSLSAAEVACLLSRDHGRRRPDFFRALKRCYLHGFEFHSDSFVCVKRPLRQKRVGQDCLFPPFAIERTRPDGTVDHECYIVCRSVRLAPLRWRLPDLLKWVLDPHVDDVWYKDMCDILDLSDRREDASWVRHRPFALQCLASWASLVKWHVSFVHFWALSLHAVLGPHAPSHIAAEDDLNRLSSWLSIISVRLCRRMYLIVTDDDDFKLGHPWQCIELEKWSTHITFIDALEKRIATGNDVRYTAPVNGQNADPLC